MRAILPMSAVLFLFSISPLIGQDDPFAEDGANAAQADPFSDPFGGGRPAVKKKPAQPKQTKGVRVVTRDPSVANNRIRGVLGNDTTQTFIETPLSDAAGQLSRAHDIPIVINQHALEEVGLTPDTPINISLKEVSLRSFLRLMLRGLELTYVIKDEVLIITTTEDADKNVVLEMYTFPEVLAPKADDVVDALTESVSAKSWSTMGGTSTAMAIDNVLIISAPEWLHEQVIDFLKKLDKAFEHHQPVSAR